MAFVASATQQDRQDFVGTEALNAAPLFLNAGPNIAHGETTGLFDVRRWPYLQLRMFCNTAGRTMWVLVQWFDDVSSTNVLGATSFTTQSSARIVDAVPNQGPYCLVTVFWDDAATHAGSGVIMGRQTPGISGVGDGQAGAVTQRMISMTSTLLATGTAITTNAVFVQHGWASLHAALAASGCFVALDVLDTGGVWDTTYFGRTLIAGEPVNVHYYVPVPSQQLRMRLGNNSGANQTLSGHLTMGPSTH